MGVLARILNLIVAALLPLFLAPAATAQDAARLDGLFTRLQTADAGEAKRIEREIVIEWSKSGSPALDLLLQRGRDAMAVGRNDLAVQHLTALVDNDPGFAEGWNARATAFYNMGEFGPALSDIAHVVALNPRHFGALAGLAMILEATDDHSRAIRVYQAALAIHPHLEGAAEAVERLEVEAAGQEL